MNSAKNPNIIFIGAGNIATNLAISFFNAGCNIVQIYSRSLESAKKLADKVNSNAINNLSAIANDADFYFICIPDKAIKSAADELSIINGIVVHTSGSTDISVLSKFNNHGVFYPFQTFSKNKVISFKEIPICLSANSDETFKILYRLSILIGNKVIELDSETRSWLHLSGVIANNFTNHLLALSYNLSKEKGFDFELLKPLVLETVQKAFEGDPAKTQTGPAIRDDHTTINAQIEKLKEYSPQLADLYKALTLSIQELAKSNK